MRPLRLQMQGFAAFRDRVEVDFADVELAALVGPTGSGKSSIIDAITFALFGSVVRYQDLRAVAPAVNQLATEARVSFEFEVSGHGYRVARVVRRTAKGATTSEARLERGDEVLAGSVTELDRAVSELLGLDFDRFTKTVVLPQGKFATFLHDRASDRQELLRHLLDLGVYSRIGAVARGRARTAADQLAVLEEELAPDAPGEATLDELTARVEALEDLQRVIDAELRALAASETALQDADRLVEGLGALVWATATVDVPAEVVAIGADHERAEVAATEIRQALAAAERHARLAEAAAADGPNAEVCRRLLADHERHAEVVDEMARLEAAVEAATREAETARARAEAVRAELTEADRSVVTAREVARAADRALREGPSRAEIEQHRNRQLELARLEAERAAAEQLAAPAEADLSEARAARQIAAEALEAAAVALDAARAEQGAEGLRGALVPGGRCPVCLQTVHDVPDHDIAAELQAAAAAHRTAHEHDRTALERLDAAVAAHARLHGELDAVSRRLAALREAVDAGPTSDELDAGERRLDELERAARDAAGALEDAERAADERRRDPAARDVLSAESEAASSLASITATRDSRREELARLGSTLADAPPVEQLLADVDRAAELARARSSALAVEAEARTRAERAVEVLAEVQGRVDAARHRLVTRRDGLAALGPPRLTGALLEDWTALADWAAGRCRELAQEHRRAEEEATGLAGEVRRRRRTVVDRCAPHVDVSGDATALPVRLATRAAEARSELERAVEARRLHLERMRRIDELREQRTVDEALGRLLQVDGFEQWLMEEAVADLVARATVRLEELSGGQYALVAQGAELLIRDHRNADEVRDAKTLSGGETFLASLALALALADSAAELAPEGSPELGSLFLDEGFGTLDPETLDVVAVAIEELGAAGRMVVIVTHIRDLAERMPVRFEVERGPTSSTVRRVEV